MAIIDLTTTARVMDVLDIPDEDATITARLALLVTSVSRRIEQYLNRPVEAVSRTEYHDVAPYRMSYRLMASPVTSITTLKVSTAYDWGGTATKVEGTDYTLDPETGIIAQLTAWLVGSRALQVEYVAGLAANTAAVLTDHPDLADACEKQVVTEWERRMSLLRTASTSNGSTETSPSVTLIPIVREALQPYRRPSW